MTGQKNRQVETRMVAEYLVAQYAQYPCLQKVPLGVVPNPLLAQVGYQKALGIMRPFRPEADALVILPNYILLIEAKVWNVVNGLAKLPLYKALVPVTPELQQYLPRPVIMELVVGQTNSNLEIMAREHNVAIKLYNPPWLQDVVAGMNQYWTAEYQAARQQKIALRQFFGIE